MNNVVTERQAREREERRPSPGGTLAKEAAGRPRTQDRRRMRRRLPEEPLRRKQSADGGPSFRMTLAQDKSRPNQEAIEDAAVPPGGTLAKEASALAPLASGAQRSAGDAGRHRCDEVALAGAAAHRGAGDAGRPPADEPHRRYPHRTTWAFISQVVVVLLVAATPAAADPQDLANRIAHEVMSPFCPGLTLHDCPSKQAVELRAQIQTWAERGWSRKRIFDELEAEYGPSIRAAPEPAGAGLLAWVLPGLGLAGGAVAAWWAARRWATRPRPTGAEGKASVAPSPEERRRLDAELRELREQT